MIPLNQIKLIDKDTNVAMVLHALAVADKPMRQADIISALNGELSSHQVNSVMIRAMRARYCTIEITGSSETKYYELTKMNLPMSTPRLGRKEIGEKKTTPQIESKFQRSINLINSVFGTNQYEQSYNL